MTLANKYRPTNLSQVVGQEAVIAALRGALQAEDISPTILFCGPHGVGKTTLAWLVALYANCTNRTQTEEVCGKCASCTQIIEAIKTGSDTPAVIEKQVSERGIDAIRVLEQQAKYRSPHKYRFFIIDEVHNLTRQAFDAALRLFEKPQSQSRFILCTTNPELLPSTIRSRAVIYYLNTVPPKKLAKKLLYPICHKENINLTPKELVAISTAVDGHPRDALNLLFQVASAGKNGTDLVESLPELIKQAEATKPYIAVQKYLNCVIGGKCGTAIAQALQITAHDYFIGQLIVALEQILLYFISPSLMDPAKAYLLKNINIPPKNRVNLTKQVEILSAMLNSCLTAQHKIKQYTTNNTAILEVLAVDLSGIASGLNE